MRLLSTFALMIGLTTNSFATSTDTVDYWTVTINGKPLINSSATAIMYGHPMKIELSAFNEIDTLQMFYWTDHGSERQKWYYILKDSNNSVIDTFTNPIDSALDQNKFRWRKNYVAFTVDYLRTLLKEKNLGQIFVEIEFDNSLELNPYKGKAICIFSNS